MTFRWSSRRPPLAGLADRRAAASVPGPTDRSGTASGKGVHVLRRSATLLVPLLLLVACTRLPDGATAGAGSPAATGAPPVSLDTGVDPVVAVVRAVKPAVVNVTATGTAVSIFGGSQQTRGVGTGFVVRADGIIVTNYHVVEGAQQLTVTTSGDSPKRYDARVIGGDALRIAEAVRRRRLETTPDDVFVERLLGLQLSQAQVQRGKDFIAGVVDRAGEPAITELFGLPDSLPTPAEIEAPGLWIARLGR